jgi:hypothetical protein
MPYCEPIHVKDLINTDLDDADLARKIVRADADLDDRLNGFTMTAFNKQECSARLTAIMIAQNQRSVFKNTGDLKIVNSGNIHEWQTYVDEKIEDALKVTKTPKGKVFTRQRCSH